MGKLFVANTVEERIIEVVRARQAGGPSLHEMSYTHGRPQVRRSLACCMVLAGEIWGLLCVHGDKQSYRLLGLPILRPTICQTPSIYDQFKYYQLQLHTLPQCDGEHSLGSAEAAFTACVPSSAQCCLQLKTSNMAGALRSDRQNLKMQVGDVVHITCFNGWGWQPAESITLYGDHMEHACSGGTNLQQHFLTAAAQCCLDQELCRIVCQPQFLPAVFAMPSPVLTDPDILLLCIAGA